MKIPRSNTIPEAIITSQRNALLSGGSPGLSAAPKHSAGMNRNSNIEMPMVFISKNGIGLKQISAIKF
jgi:hypothetical protein